MEICPLSQLYLSAESNVSFHFGSPESTTWCLYWHEENKLVYDVHFLLYFPYIAHVSPFDNMLDYGLTRFLHEYLIIEYHGNHCILYILVILPWVNCTPESTKLADWYAGCETSGTINIYVINTSVCTFHTIKHG